MVAVSFHPLKARLATCFSAEVFNHDDQRIAPWDSVSGNAIFVCRKG